MSSTVFVFPMSTKIHVLYYFFMTWQWYSIITYFYFYFVLHFWNSRTRVYFLTMLLKEPESMASVYKSRTSPELRPLSSWVLYPSSSSSSSFRTPWAVTMPPPLSSQLRPRAAVTWWPVPLQRHSLQEPKVQPTRKFTNQKNLNSRKI